jgi:iron(III) transport system permease protein
MATDWTRISGIGAARLRSRQPQRLLLLWLPTVLVLLAVLLPLVYLVIRALQGGQSSLDLLLRTRTLGIIGNSLLLAASVAAASAALALSYGWLTARTDLPGARIFQVLGPLPLVIPSYVGAYLLAGALGPRGLLQSGLETIAGVERLPDIYGFPGAFLALTLLSYPYVLLPVQAALQRMDPALEESARSLGKNPLATFWRVTLPQLRPALTAGGLLVALYALRDFGAVSIMRFTTFTRAIYIQYLSAFDRSSAAALSLVLVVFSLILLSLEMRSRPLSARYYSEQTGGGSRVGPIKLAGWRWPAFAFCAGLISLALLLPAGVLGYWLVRGLQTQQQLNPLMAATGNSILASALAAAVTVLLALPLAILLHRRQGRLFRWIERISHLGFALPGVVIALSLVFFGARYVPLLYGGLPLLILAYGILFLPQASNSLRSSLLQISPRLREASLSLGQSPLATFRRVTLPLIQPGVLASLALVFLTAMKELQATLLLSPLGFETLATRVWSAVSEAFFAQAAAPALLILVTSSIPMAFLVFGQRINAN